MRQLLIMMMWVSVLGTFDAVSFGGGYRTASWQWAQSQGSEVRYEVRRLIGKAFGG